MPRHGGQHSLEKLNQFVLSMNVYKKSQLFERLFQKFGHACA